MDEPKSPEPKRAPNADEPKPAVKPAGPPPSLEEGRLTFEVLAAHKGAFELGELLAMLRDGRDFVRANAALAIAVVGYPATDLVTQVRDSERIAAVAAAEAIGRLGAAARELVPTVVAATATTHPEVTENIVGVLLQLIGQADDELCAALDVPLEVAQKSVIAACERLGRPGVALLAKATRHDAIRVRINAVAGLAEIGKLDFTPASAALSHLQSKDPVPDVRAAAKKAMLVIVARERRHVIDATPTIPDFEARKLSSEELAAHESAIDLDQMIYTLRDGRNHVRVNAARGLAVLRQRAAPAAGSLGLLMRDSAPAVRKEAAIALGKIGFAAIAAAPDLCGALGDEADVADAAFATLASWGDSAEEALVKALETGDDQGGRRVGELVAKLAAAPALLAAAFKSPAVNVQVNAALALGLLGNRRIGAGKDLLLGARTGGDKRTRAAVREALERLEPRAAQGPKPVAVAGFESEWLAASAFGEGANLDVGDLIMHLQDGRAVVRANAAIALGSVGANAHAAALPLGVLLRDDESRVRIAAALAVDKLGDDAVREIADSLVGALRGDPEVAKAVAPVLAARKARVTTALVKGLETDDDVHARRILEVIKALPDALEILLDALESPAEHVQANAATGIGMLGTKRAGVTGRKALESRRTGEFARTRASVFKALAALDATP